jgi:hypothetical protein
MRNCFIIFFILSIITGCKQSDQQELNLKVFKITVPKNWSYHQINGFDSFIGEIKMTNSALTFDYSSLGYASSLTQTEEEFLTREVRGFGDSANGKKATFRKLSKAEMLKFPDIDYIIDYNINVDGKNKIESALIKVPQEIKQVNIRFDTIGKYIVKTIWPKKQGVGETGIYYHGLHNDFTFCMSGRNLDG